MCSHLCVSVPCCPENVAVSAVSTDTLEITWTASMGAELYETRAADASEVILCNDTAPVCALSDLSCDRAYSVVVTPCNEISGCNRDCKAHTKDTGDVPFKLLLQFAVEKHSCHANTYLAKIIKKKSTLGFMGSTSACSLNSFCINFLPLFHQLPVSRPICSSLS